MYAAEGVGLAANQIGVDLTVFVYDCPDDDGVRHVGHVVNPVLVSGRRRARRRQRGLPVRARPPTRGRARTRWWRATTRTASRSGVGDGYFARCLQHETDHLDGRLYIDRLRGRTKRKAMREVLGTDWASR